MQKIYIDAYFGFVILEYDCITLAENLSLVYGTFVPGNDDMLSIMY